MPEERLGDEGGVISCKTGGLELRLVVNCASLLKDDEAFAVIVCMPGMIESIPGNLPFSKLVGVTEYLPEFGDILHKNVPHFTRSTEFKGNLEVFCLSLSGLDGGVTVFFDVCCKDPGSTFISGFRRASSKTESQLIRSFVARTLHFFASSTPGTDFRFFKFTFLFF